MSSTGVIIRLETVDNRVRHTKRKVHVEQKNNEIPKQYEEIIEGNGDLESFKQLFDLSGYSVFERPSFPLKMSETEVIEFNNKRLMIMENILNFQNAKSKDDRKTAIVEFEQGLKNYKKAFDAWLELENKCSDMGGFCTRRD